MAILDQSHTATAQSAGALRFSTNFQKYGEQFTPSITNPIAEVHFFLYKQNAPSGNVWCEIWSDSSALPGSLLCQSDNVACSSISSTDFNNPNEITFTFTTTPSTLTSGTPYWMVFNGDYTISTTVWVAITRTDTTDQFSGHSAVYTGSWANTDPFDYRFKEYYNTAAATKQPSGLLLMGIGS